MRPRAAATSRIIGDANHGISRSIPLVLRVTCVLALLVHAATWIPIAEAVVSTKRPRLSTKCFCLRGLIGVTIERWSGARNACDIASIIVNVKRDDGSLLKTNESGGRHAVSSIVGSTETSKFKVRVNWRTGN
ncbi:hypothetical protein ALC60_04360 [Trachymyrmex zeteki]|uniref:Uncharacterized protein n=1 Tax=Mycetomoellerius zeteki TaxID=64791 RepID=A0A151X8R3_9HYME|nr:hypothetical protein ALC60_04360 [Trachymyrmex zeteki]